MDWFFMLIAILATFQAAHGTAKLSLRMDFLSIPGGKTKEKQCCDGGIFTCSNKCDPYLKVCIDTNESSQDDLTSCSVATFETAYTDDSIEISFGSTIGSSNSPNPRVLDITTWPGFVFLKVEVRDHDEHKADDVIDYLVSTINKTADASEADRIETSVTMTGAVMLQATLNVYCDPYYYGPGCDTYCDPTEGSDCQQFETKPVHFGEAIQKSHIITTKSEGAASPREELSEVECPAVSEPENGHVTYPNGRNVKNSLIYRCKIGYVLQGCSTRWCQADGKWTPVAADPTCQLVQCLPAAQPENGFAIYPTGWNVNDTLEYRCEIGFVLKGPGKRQCQADGKWSPMATDPICQPIIKIGALSSSGIKPLPYTAVFEILLGIFLMTIIGLIAQLT